MDHKLKASKTNRALPSVFLHKRFNMNARKLDGSEPDDIFSETCDDASICYNGSTCKALEKGFIYYPKDRKYRCDCSPATTTGVEFYAGYGCQYDANEYCFIGGLANTNGGLANSNILSFCTNGDCVEKWMPAENEMAE